MAYNTFTPIITNGLIFCLDPTNLKSYIGSGTSSYDIKSLQVGELVNGVGFSGEFIFDGIDDVINFGPDGVAQQLRGTSEFTITVWVRKTSSTSDAIFSAYDGTSPFFGWFLQWYSDDTIYCGSRDSSNGYNSSSLIWTDDWYNLVFIYDGSQSLDIDKAYTFVNGQPQTMTNVGVIESTVSTASIDFWVGSATNYAGYLEGRCSSVMIYNRILSADEVLQNYNALKNRFIYE